MDQLYFEKQNMFLIIRKKQEYEWNSIHRNNKKINA